MGADHERERHRGIQLDSIPQRPERLGRRPAEARRYAKGSGGEPQQHRGPTGARVSRYRRTSQLPVEQAGISGRLSGWTLARVHVRIDAAGRAGSAGLLRQSWRTVCGARLRPLARVGHSHGDWLDAPAHLPAIAHRSNRRFSYGRSTGSAAGQHSAQCADAMASADRYPDSASRTPKLGRLPFRIRCRDGHRIDLWRSACPANLECRSQSGVARRYSVSGFGTAMGAARCAPSDPDRPLLPAGYSIVRLSACLAKTFQLPLGFNPDGVTLATFDLQLANYNSTEAGVVQQRLLQQVAELPGVTAAAYGNSVPLSIDQSNTSIFAEGTKDFRASTQKLNSTYYQISPGYFAAIGAPLLAGRDITLADNDKAPKVAIVNEAFARKLTGSTQAVGKRFIRGDNLIEIVGIVPDGKYQTLTEDPDAAVFFPIAQSSNTSTVLVVRSRLSSAEMIPAIRQAIANVDSSIPVFSISSWPDALGLMLLPARAATIAL